MSDLIKQLENLLARSKDAKYFLRLYDTGSTRLSSGAVANIKEICETHSAGRYDLRVVDLYAEPQRIKEEKIAVAPTPVKQQLLPVRRFIGDLLDRPRVLMALGPEPKAEK